MSEKCDCVDKCARWNKHESEDGTVIVFTPYIPKCVDPYATKCKMIDPEFETINPTYKFETRYDIVPGFTERQYDHS
jgi:hypothetical protein